MLELLIVGGLVALVTACAWVPAQALLAAGLWCTLGGFAFGVPLGIAYHVALWLALRQSGGAPKGWIWRPISLNSELTYDQRRWVLPLCWAGAAGFGFVVLGVVLFVVGLARGGLVV